MEHNAKIESMQDKVRHVSRNRLLQERKEENAKKWLNQRKMNLAKRNRARRDLLNSEAGEHSGDLSFGNMFFFRYDAKTKLKLPYYDEYPLILPFDTKMSKAGNKLVYGLNLHYMPPSIRATILDILRVNKGGRLMIPLSNIVKTIAKDPRYMPAIHAYIPANMSSTIQRIHPEDWENVIFLPVANFISHTRKTGVGLATVYRDYMNKM